MMTQTTFSPGPLRGTIRVAGDKSISHRAVMLGSIAQGQTIVRGLNRGADLCATIGAMRALGAVIDDDGTTLTLTGSDLRAPSTVLDCMNSGTTTRLLMGLCAGMGIDAQFDGDASLRSRPMERIARPLRAMGATVTTTDGKLPARVIGIERGPGGTFALEIPSAQIKSAILLANLRADRPTMITGDAFSRDHSERMLRSLGADIEWDGHTVALRSANLAGKPIDVPGDVSAAAFFLVAAATTPGSDLTIEHIGLNRSRDGIIVALREMGAAIDVIERAPSGGEEIVDLRVRSSRLHAIDLDEGVALRAIDEIPVLAVAAAYAHGTTRIRKVADLRAKESDRIASTAALLRAAGITVDEKPDGFDIYGGSPQAPRQVIATHDDHRIAMSAAALAAGAGPVSIDAEEAIAVSFPEFRTVWQSARV